MKLSNYIGFLNNVYGGSMDKAGIVECIMANSVGYANGLIGRPLFLATEKHYVGMLKKFS